MKKIYSLAFAALMALPAMAQGVLTLPGQQQLTTAPQLSKITLPQNGTMTAMKAPAQAGEMLSLDLGYCGNIASCTQINSGETGIAVAFPASMLASMEGNQITAINVASPVNIAKSDQNTQKWVNTLTTCKVAVSESLGGTPVVETEGTLGEGGFEWNTIKLDQPYTITKGKNVYISVMYTGVTNNDCPVIVDNLSPANNYSFYLYSRYQSVNNQGQIVLQDNYQWKTFGEIMGRNACLTCTVEGTTLPTDQGYVVLDQSDIAIKPGRPFQYLAAIYNEGANEIKNVELTMNIPGQAPQSKTVDVVPFYENQTTINFHEYCIASAEFTCDKEGYFDYDVTVTKVNGVANKLADEAYEGTLLCLENGYPVTSVCEEYTSTLCGYCPIGIVAMEQMKEKYGGPNGRFIPIAVHGNMNGTDPMNVMSAGGPYNALASYVAGFPSSFFMRKMNDNISPSPDNVEAKIKEYNQALAPFQLKATIEKTDDEDIVNLNIEADCSLTDSQSYGFIYTLLEDGVGPYQQYNYYSGGRYGQCYGWENKPSTVSMKYNDVARKGSVVTPANNAIFQGVEKDQKYSHTYQVNLNNITNLANYSIAAMLVNASTGEVVNACLVYSPDNSGVDSVVSESVQAVAYGLKGAVDMVYAGNIYTIDGRMVAKDVKGEVSLPAGIYVVATANGTAKVVVR